MATVRQSPRFNIIRKPQGTSRKVSVDSIKRAIRQLIRKQTRRHPSVVPATDVIDDVSDQSNKECVDAGFCGEPFADNDELLSSLSPLLFSMKLCGLYFYREDPHRRRTDDPEWNPTTSTTTSSRSTGLRVYATVVLILAWLNVTRFASVFTRNDYFGAILMLKIAIFTWFVLAAIFQTTCYFACHTGQLLKILLTLPVTRDCVRGARRVAIGLTALIWIMLIGDLTVGGYIFIASDEYSFILAPFDTYIYIPTNKINIAKMVGYLGYVLIFLGVFFAHAMNQVIVYIFYSQFKKLKKNFRRALGERGQFTGDFSLFRRRHQILSRAVSKVDGYMRLSNVAGFVCHILNIILLLYSVIFYPETWKNFMSALSYLMWLVANIHGLLFSASAGIIVNHMVRKSICRSTFTCLTLFCSGCCPGLTIF